MNVQFTSCVYWVIRARFGSVVLHTDIEKAFLQIRIKEKERESLKFQWVENITKPNSDSAFDQANIWVNQSTFILQAAPKTHFGRYESKYLGLHKK